MKLIFGCVLFIGLVALLGFALDKLDTMKSTSWPIVSGKLLDIEDKRVSMPIIGRFAPVSMPYVKYSYTVDSKTFTGEKTAGPCLRYVRMACFKQPEMTKVDSSALLNELRAGGSKDFSKIMETIAQAAQHREYKPIMVRYEPDHPENSVPDPSVLQSSTSLWWTSVLFIAVGGLGLGALLYHGYIVAPVDDPSLSLEQALKARGQRR